MHWKVSKKGSTRYRGTTCNIAKTSITLQHKLKAVITAKARAVHK